MNVEEQLQALVAQIEQQQKQKLTPNEALLPALCEIQRLQKELLSLEKDWRQQQQGYFVRSLVEYNLVEPTYLEGIRIMGVSLFLLPHTLMFMFLGISTYIVSLIPLFFIVVGSLSCYMTWRYRRLKRAHEQRAAVLRQAISLIEQQLDKRIFDGNTIQLRA